MDDERSENSGDGIEDNASDGGSVDEISYNSSEHMNNDSDEEGRTHDSDEEVQNDDSDEEYRSHDSDEEDRDVTGNISPSFPSRSRFMDYDEPLSKRRRRLKKDRLSTLPDSALLHIISYLPTEYAVRTGILSQRWLHLWTSVPNLTFSVFSRLCKFSNFFNFVDQTLILHKSDLKRFALEFMYNDSVISRVTAWLRFATRTNVEDLCLDLYGTSMWRHVFDRHVYVLPQHLYTNSKLANLSLAACDLVPVGRISWEAMKSLSIGYTKLSEDVIQKILAGSPLLDSLELHNFKGLNCLDIGNSNLKKLILREYWGPQNGRKDDSELDIIAPKLRSLSISGCMHQRKLKLTNVQMVDDCTLNLERISYEEYNVDFEVHGNLLIELLQRLNHVNKLTLDNHSIKVLSHMEEKGVFLPDSTRKCLTLQTLIHSSDLPGIASILRNSPLLETLHIDMTSTDCTENDLYRNFFENYEFELLRLKTVRIIGFVRQRYRYEHVAPLTKFLLKIAKVLEKMIISAQKVGGGHYRRKNTPREILAVAQKLLSFPRSSPQAVVEFCS